MVRGSATAERLVRTDGVIVDARIDDGELQWLSWDGERLANHRGTVLAKLGPTPRRSIRVCGDGAVITEGSMIRGLGQAALAGGPALADLVPQAGAGASVAISGDRLFRVVNGAILRQGLLGEQVVGHGLCGQTRIWAGEHFGVGWYRAGAMTVALVFDLDRTGVIEVMDLPTARGQLLSAHCAVGQRLAWLTTVEQLGGRELARCVAIDEQGRVLGVAESALDECPWLAGARGGAAVGQQLFVPTDDGILRVEIDAVNGGQLVVTRSFPDTSSFVDGASRLLVGRTGLHVVSRSTITRLSLSSNP